jgi:glycerophosphoryl diester phosphodiesterase
MMEETVTISRESYDSFIELSNEYKKAEIAIRNRFIRIGFNGSFYIFDSAERCVVIDSLERDLKRNIELYNAFKEERNKISNMSIFELIKWKRKQNKS